MKPGEGPGTVPAGGRADGTGRGAEQDSRSRIVAAAMRQFGEYGLQGARTQAIADEAGVNKAMIYYHFDSKEHLYEEVISGPFRMIAGEVLPVLARSDLPPRERLARVVEGYQRFLLLNPYVRNVMLQELAAGGRHLGGLVARVRKDVPGFDMSLLLDALEQMMADGHLHRSDPRQTLIHLLALTVFPFMARPLIELLWGLPEGGFERLLAERPAAILALLEHGMLTLPGEVA